MEIGEIWKMHEKYPVQIEDFGYSADRAKDGEGDYVCIRFADTGLPKCFTLSFFLKTSKRLDGEMNWVILPKEN